MSENNEQTGVVLTSRPEIVSKINKPVKPKLLTIKNSFVDNLMSLKYFIDMVNPIVSQKDQDAKDKMVNHVENAFKAVGVEIKKHDVNAKDVKLSNDQAKALVDSILKMPKMPVKNSKILKSSSFVMLMSYFEYLFADLLKFYYQEYPGSLKDKDISIQLNDLENYNTIEEAREYLIQREVDSILFDLNFEKTKEYFKDKFKISLEEKIIDWAIIDDAKERRNLIVHNDSKINKKYLGKVPNKYKGSLKEGDQIDIDDEYFLSIFNEIYLAGLILIYNCWGNWRKEEVDTAISELMNSTFELLKSEQYNIVLKICEYSDKNIKPTNDVQHDALLRVEFNHCIALKLTNQKNKLNDRLSKIRSSTLSPIFKVAYYALKDNKKEVMKYLSSAKDLDDLEYEDIMEWPLFREMRSEIDFMEFINKVYTPSPQDI